MSPFLAYWTGLPKPYDQARAESGLQHWRDAAERTGDEALAAFARELAEDPAGRALLTAVFGNSPFLSQCLLSDPHYFRTLVTDGADVAFPALLDETHARLRNETDTGRLMRELRRAKRRAALAIALADIAGCWPLPRVTEALSAFADAALRLAVAHLLRRSAAAGEFALADEADPERGSGFFVLGMGKLGAEELNYSSDIDLMIFYVPERIAYTGDRSLQDCMVHLTRELVRVIEQRTEDGYVFRTDLRLRPDPGATPVAMSVLAAETYYESMGQNWERAAMIKARPVAGDREAATEFLHRLAPYVWRKHLDFAAIQDIHSIKRQIDTHRGGYRIEVKGQNLKLGGGGIREIEFFAQTQQLIWGGRMPGLRSPRTCEALEALAAAGRIEKRVAEDLIAAYRFLRQVEHRLQMIEDRQTHIVPADEAGLNRLASFLGFPGSDEFAEVLLRHLRAVQRHYDALFAESVSLGGPGNLVFTGADPDPETLQTLAGLGFRNGEGVARVIMGWHHGRYPATRSVRARELLTELMPALLTALSKTASPDAAFMKFNDFLSRLPAGVQLFSLFYSNPALLDLVAEIMGNAPRLADLLAHRPILLDGVLTPGFYKPLAKAGTLARELEAALRQARDFEAALDITRRWVNDKKFQLGVQILRNVTKSDATGAGFADVAEVSIRALLPWVEEDFARRHGRVPGSRMAIVAMGKLGGREMLVGSDLDLVFVYDNPEGAEASDGPRPLTPHEYYARLSRLLISAITAQTAEGRLYEVDMRLRPSGTSGPIASSLEAFVRYQKESAWTWEHQALTRARVISGPSALRRAISKAVRAVLTRRRDSVQLARDVADMRERIGRERPGESVWDVKNVRGGLIDVEFIAQFLQLRHAHDHREILARNTIEALEKVSAAGLLPAETASELVAAARQWQRILGLLRLCYRVPFPEEEAQEGSRRVLVEAAEAVDFPDLEQKMAATAERVHGIFRELILVPAGTEVRDPQTERSP
ncbi:MAG: bifunctional [glutamine synthetase] adenylyltransferase/[glutamine synthetase]-adenylyl-L-tyrosine phosphorylase [Alphaproteobacteria bacterium]